MAEDEDKSATRKIKARMKLAKTATMNQFDLAKLGLLRMTSKGNLYEPSTKGTVTYEGFLFKKSPGGIPLMRHWHKRWFVLESPGKLLYYTGQDKLDLKGIIPLDMIEKMLFRATRLTLLMEGASETEPPRKFSLKGDSDTTVQSWGAAINKCFEELDRIDEEEENENDRKLDNIGQGDSKYWKVETRKKLNLSVALEDKPKKKKGVQLKIDPRAKEIEAQIANKEVSVAAAYMPLNDDCVSVPASSAAVASEAGGPSLAASPEASVASSSPQPEERVANSSPLEASIASSSPPPEAREQEDAAWARQQSEQAERERVERQRARQLQEEADLVAAIAASQMDLQAQPMVELEG
jgi:hypothetical protein